MKASLLAYVASACLMAAFVPSHARASYLCDAPTQTMGANDGRNPVVQTMIGINGATSWFVDHRLQDGTIIHRADQYNMQPIPNTVGWNGYLNKTNHLWMEGWLTNISNDSAETVIYNEALHDSAKGDAVIMRSYATCHALHDNKPKPAIKQYVPPVAPSESPVSHDSVSFTLTSKQQIIVSVGMGGWAVDMQLDTGANESSVGEDLANRLVRDGHAVAAGEGQVKLADGSVVTERRITVTAVTIGTHTVNNVTMGVVKDGVNMLLGLPVLNAIGKFTIDSANQRLTF